MGKVIVANHLTLDGVMQSPGAPDEDTRGGFTHGGWARMDEDPAVFELMGREFGDIGGYLFGRRTYEKMASFWPQQTDGNPITEMFNTTQKYVASKTLTDPLDWANSTVLEGDVASAVANLKEREAGNLVMFGSGDLLQTLMPHQLVDVYVLLLHPLVLGTGRRMFPEGTGLSELRLVRTETSPAGVVVATYYRA